MSTKQRPDVGIDLAKLQIETEKSTAPFRQLNAEIGKNASEMQERMRFLAETCDENSALRELTKQIAEQQRAIEGMPRLGATTHALSNDCPKRLRSLMTM